MWNKELAKQLIEKSGLRKRYIAEKIGLELESFNQYLYGQNKPGKETLEKLAIILKSSVSELELKSKKVG